MLDNEVLMTRKDFNIKSGKGVPLNMFERRQRTELKNLEASRLIKAAKALNKASMRNAPIAPEIDKARKELNNPKLIETKYSAEVIDRRLEEMNRRIADIEKKQEAANGFIKPGDAKRLEIYKLEVSKLSDLKKEILKPEITNAIKKE